MVKSSRAFTGIWTAQIHERNYSKPCLPLTAISKECYLLCKKTFKKLRSKKTVLFSLVLLAAGLIASVALLTSSGLLFGNSKAALTCNSQTLTLQRCKPGSPHIYQKCSKYNGSYGTKYYWKDAGNCGDLYCVSLSYMSEYGAVACVNREFTSSQCGKNTLGLEKCDGTSKAECRLVSANKYEFVAYYNCKNDGASYTCLNPTMLGGPARCVSKTPPTPTPTPTSAQSCNVPNFCATRTECNQYGGTVVAGKCATGEICCKEIF